MARGPQGPIGLTGSAGGGYATLDAISTPFDADADPGSSVFTSQNLPYPVGTQKPALAFLIRNLASYAGRRDRAPLHGERRCGRRLGP